MVASRIRVGLRLGGPRVTQATRVEIETSPTPFRPDGPITELAVSFRTDASDRHLSAPCR
ncbi:hypothetical protein E4U09_003424 [Claviceps aff. purpurea]|uniref:Uncharacterized protein n=1 Tax=Claviceps aff. purpurea TaxID=1967640 RepID=A0A9P7QEM2_9HYPO|nr:hypothetical protein E4U09_003424 [Claviceps aff. purpurea]